MTNINIFKIEDTPGFNINRASIILRKRLTAMLKEVDIDITPEEFSILSRLWEEDGITQSLLVEKTIKDKTRVTRLLNSLIDKSYVYKEVKVDDRRNQIVFLTKQGMSIKTIIVPIILKLMDQASQGITKEEIEITNNVLKRIFSNLNDIE